MHEPFFILGLVLFAGFVSNIVFERTRISQVLILIALGFLLGPALGFVDASTGSVLAGLTSFVGTLALIILLFNGGITLNVFDLVGVLPKATAFTLLVFILSLFASVALSSIAFGWNLFYGLLLGGALGGTCSVIVLTMVEKVRGASDGSKSLLALESTITDALCIVTVFAVLQLIKSNATPDASVVLNLLAGAFSIAIMAGAISAAAWLLLLKRVGKDGFPYMLTLATVFILYALVEAARGNGAIAVFAFGLVLGNAKRVAEFLRLEGDYTLDGEIASTQSEVTFFTRTFFFVFLGLVLNPAGISLPVAAFGIALGLAFLLVRIASRRLVLPESPDARLVATMLPRGLAAAVLAGLPAAQGIEIPGFTEIALIVIVLTNVIATAGLFTLNGKPAAPLPAAIAPRVVATKELKGR